jgi:hypothetical protein
MDFVTENISTEGLAAGVNQSDDEEISRDSCPAHRDVIPSDLQEISTTDEVIFIVGTQSGKVTRIGGLDEMHNLKVFFCHFCAGQNNQ